jgi:predicted PolB exonuclease-like 3'-5' exonuclease
MNKLILDIETIPNQNLQEDLMPKFDETTVKLGVLKDPVKIEAKIEKAKEAFKNGLTKKMSLESNFAQILSLGYIEINDQGEEIQRGVLFNESNDKQILEDFAKIYKGQQIIGWNSKRFDLPLIWKRGIFQNIKIFRDNIKHLCNPYRDDSLDLMLDFNAGNMGKMSACAKLLGIECKTGLDGSMIYDAFKAEQYEEIKDYNLEDCDCTLSIYRRLYT